MKYLKSEIAVIFFPQYFNTVQYTIVNDTL